MPRFADEGGRQLLAQTLFDTYKHKIRCPTCPGTAGAQGYNLDSAGKSPADGFLQRYFACRQSNSRSSTEGCRRASCAKYIKHAYEQLKPDDFFDVVRRVRSRFEQGSEYYQALGTYLQSGLPSTSLAACPSTSSVYSPTSPTHSSTSPAYPLTSPPTSPCRQQSTDRHSIFSRFARPTTDQGERIDLDSNAEPVDTFKRPAKRKADTPLRGPDKRCCIEALSVESVVDEGQGGHPKEDKTISLESLLTQLVEPIVARLVERLLTQTLECSYASKGSIGQDDNIERDIVSAQPQTPCPQSETTPPVLLSPIDSSAKLPDPSLHRTQLKTLYKTPSTSSNHYVRSLAVAFRSANKTGKKSIRAEAKTSGLFNAFKDEVRKAG